MRSGIASFCQKVGFPTQTLSASVIGAVLTLGIACTAFTYTMWNWGIQRIEASRAGVFVNLEPVVGAFLGVTVLGDPLASSSFVGGFIVIACALMVCLPRTRARANGLAGRYNRTRSDATIHYHRSYLAHRRFGSRDRAGRRIAVSPTKCSQSLVVGSVGSAQE